MHQNNFWVYIPYACYYGKMVINSKWEKKKEVSSKIENVLGKIERLRQDMHRLAGKKGIQAPEVLTISQQIDVELNEYYKLRKYVSQS